MGMFEQGTIDPFKVVEKHQNALAKQRKEIAKLTGKGVKADAFDPTQLGTLGQFENLDAMTDAITKSQAAQLAKLTEGSPGAAGDAQARLDALFAGVEGWGFVLWTRLETMQAALGGQPDMVGGVRLVPPTPAGRLVGAERGAR